MNIYDKLNTIDKICQQGKFADFMQLKKFKA